MMDPPDDAVDPEVLRLGYLRACERVIEGRWDRMPEYAFTSLFEALNWAVVLDERIGNVWKDAGRPLKFKWRARVPNADLVRAVRFARNSVHHKWALAIRLSHEVQMPPPSANDPPYRWIWRLASELPQLDRPDPRGADAYSHRVAEQPVAATLLALRDVFDAAFAKSGLLP